VVAHLADQDDVRVLPHRGAHRVTKSSVSTRTSRWLIIDILSKCSTSIGSSIVTTCTSLVALMWSIIPASVVVLPEPVGPVTSTSPRGSIASDASTGGSPRSLSEIARC
jgi:hypothetical protein